MSEGLPRMMIIIFLVLLLLWYVSHVKLYTQHGSMDISVKNILLHILMPGPQAVCMLSNLANCRFTLVLFSTVSNNYRHRWH